MMVLMASNGIILLSLYSLLTGMSSYFVKTIHGLSSQQILLYRALFASLFLLVAAIASGRLKELKFRYPASTIIMALTQGLSIYFYYVALEKTTIANAILLVYTAPVFSVILASIFLREKIEKKTLLAIALSLAGVLVVADPNQIRINQQQFTGSLFALLGGFFYSAMAISSKSLTHKTTPLYAAFWQYFIIAVMTLFFALPVKLSHVAVNLAPLLYLGWAAGGLAFLLYMQGIKMVKGQIIQVVTMLEIVIGSISGVLLLHEELTIPTVVGGALILSGVLIVSAKGKNKEG